MKLKILLRFLLTGLGFFAFLVAMALFFRPEERSTAGDYTEAEIEEAEALRATDYAFSDPPVINQEVDYTEGAEAEWYPRGEAPILAELVAEGRLPPVEERVGPEPVVMLGVEGLGTYGGTWLLGTNAVRNVENFGLLYADSHLVRWSPLGYPVVPHVAKSWEVLDGGRTYEFKLRRGMRWSDGAPFTADDILYWWDHEARDSSLGRDAAGFAFKVLQFRGKLGKVRKEDDYTIRFEFDEPNGIFLNQLATYAGSYLTSTPAHYLRKYHPTLGDPEFIQEMMEAYQMPSPQALYVKIKGWDNVEHPRLWPFIYRTHKSNPPYVYVRNPYFFGVDPAGNQLPYLDRVQYDIKSTELLNIAASRGDFSLQTGIIPSNYTMMMEHRESGGYELYHWTVGDGSHTIIWPNMNLRHDPDDPVGAQKVVLFRNAKFKQALSLAINRQEIIDVEINGMSDPVQAGPGPGSIFHEPSQYYSHVELDPERANQLLDEIGLTRRDAEGFRTLPDGSRMHFFLNYQHGTGTLAGMLEAVVDDWARIGIRATARERSVNLFRIEFEGLQHDFSVVGATGQALPLNLPRLFTITRGSWYASAWARWFDMDGFYGKDVKLSDGVQKPPEDHPIMDAVRAYDAAIRETDIDRQVEAFREALKIAGRELWTISIANSPPIVAVVKNGFHNVPRQVVHNWEMLGLGGSGRETFYMDNPSDSPGAIAQAKESMVNPTLPPRMAETLAESRPGEKLKGGGLGRWFRNLFLIGFAAAITLVAFKHPFIGRRLVIMVPTLLFISVVVFTIIQLPPGDYITTMISRLEVLGEEADMSRIEDLNTLFRLDESTISQYLHWTGLKWFVTFSPEDKGLLQGNLGRSMETLGLVNDMIGDRLLLTLMVSMGTILLTWTLALPIGIYSAVKQYSLGDYVVTFIGFLGMCIPNFLLALLLMHFASQFFGLNISGLFSPEYGAQPEWTWGKFLDLLKHIWLPIVVLGVAGTAGMIRVMRGNLLDELKKPYVTTARAKGVRPMRLLLKYPVRLALNPFISSVGVLFPQLISGGAIVAMILSLPTIGPEMIYALTSEDMYLAGTLLMLLSVLGVVGTLVSDLLLMALDPRIRMGSDSK